MLQVESIDHYHGQSHTLRDLSLAVPAGQCTCVMGRNGVGKTTLMRCIMGLEQVRRGAIRFEGEDLTRLGTERRAPMGIACVPQGRQIFSQLTVRENLQTGLFAGRGRSRHIPDWIYQQFPVLDTMAERRGGNLSGGQQQQLAIARALALNPALLILDEPTEGIQPNIVAEIGALIRRLIEDHAITVLLVEQKLPFIRKVADNFCILDRGSAVAGGAMAALDDGLVDRYLTV